MHANVEDTARWLGRVLGGWLNYYAVPGASRYLYRFVQRLKRMWLAILTPQIAKGPRQVDPYREASRTVLAESGNPTPVAGPTPCRQCTSGGDPREVPDALAGPSGSARGAPGNRRSYRDNSHGRFAGGDWKRSGYKSDHAGPPPRQSSTLPKGRDDRAGFCPCAHDACVALAEGKHSPAYGGGSLCAHTGKRQARVRPRPLPARFVPGTTFVKMKAIEKKQTKLENSISGLVQYAG